MNKKCIPIGKAYEKYMQDYFQMPASLDFRRFFEEKQKADDRNRTGDLLTTKKIYKVSQSL